MRTPDRSDILQIAAVAHMIAAGTTAAVSPDSCHETVRMVLRANVRCPFAGRRLSAAAATCHLVFVRRSQAEKHAGVKFI